MTWTRGLLIAVIVGVTLSGCSGYRIIKSDFVTPSAPSSASPLPLVVGLNVTGQTLTGGFSDMGPAFASRLTNAGLYKTVLYPVRTDDKIDLLIEAKFSGTFVADSSSFAKAFLTGFFMLLPSPFVEYEHHYKASGAVSFMQGGRQLKSYSAESDTVVAMELAAPATEVQGKGVSAATNDLIDRLIAQLNNDRDFFAGLRTGSQ